MVPILRAGLGMLDGMMRLLPTAEVGFLGMVRNEETLEASTYAERLPDDLSGRQCYVLDPMLATGGTLAAAIRFLIDRGADHITAICLLAAPEGCARLEKELDGLDVPVTVVTAAHGREAQREGLHRPGPRRRRRPAVRRGRLSRLSRALRSWKIGTVAGGDQHHAARAPGCPRIGVVPLLAELRSSSDSGAS